MFYQFVFLAWPFLTKPPRHLTAIELHGDPRSRIERSYLYDQWYSKHWELNVQVVYFVSPTYKMKKNHNNKTFIFIFVFVHK